MIALRAWRAPALLALAGLWLVGCGSTASIDPGNKTAEQVYAEAKDDMAAGNFANAATQLNRVEALAAGTLLAQQAQLDLAYAQWKTNEREAALATLDRFLKFNPSSPGYDYALYLRGLVNFNDDLGLLGNIARQDLSERDQAASRESWQSFKQLTDQFPNSSYGDDARVRMDYIVNSLANHELHVARYYFRRGAYLAAANRAQQAVSQFQHSPAAEEALFIMAQSYARLGLKDLSADAGRVLRQNHPDSRFLRDGLRLRETTWWQFW